MAERPLAIPAVTDLSRAELIALVPMIASGPISALDIARARWEASIDRVIALSVAADAAIRAYTEARARLDATQAEGRSTKGAARAVDTAYAAYRRAAAASDAAYGRQKRAYAALNEILAERGDR